MAAEAIISDGNGIQHVTIQNHMEKNSAQSWSESRDRIPVSVVHLQEAFCKNRKNCTEKNQPVLTRGGSDSAA